MQRNIDVGDHICRVANVALVILGAVGIIGRNVSLGSDRDPTMQSLSQGPTT